MNQYKTPSASEAWDHMNKMWAIRNEFESKDNYFNRLRIIGQYWKANEERLIKKPRIWFHAEAFDWLKIFSPIEMDAWIALRGKGIPMYPQYNILNYYLDFANPGFKIAIELDGKDYHDPEKDKKRDFELFKHGWKVFRIKGKEMVREYKDFSDFEDWEWRDNNDEVMKDIRHWIMNTGNGVIEAIARVYFYKKPIDPIDHEIYTICITTLRNHTYLHNYIEFL